VLALSTSSGDDDFRRLVQLKTPSSPQCAAMLVGSSFELRRPWVGHGDKKALQEAHMTAC
jgi:hypothetical protein